MPAMADIGKELGIKTASVIYLDDLHGIEYNAQAAVYFSSAGIDILSSTAVPLGVKDVSSIIKKIQGENPDLVCSFQYPAENALVYGTMAQLNYNPKAVLGGPGDLHPGVLRRLQGRARRDHVRGRVDSEDDPRRRCLLQEAV